MRLQFHCIRDVTRPKIKLNNDDSPNSEGGTIRPYDDLTPREEIRREPEEERPTIENGKKQNKQ